MEESTTAKNQIRQVEVKLLKRLELLEQENRALRRMATVLMVGFALLGGTAVAGFVIFLGRGREISAAVHARAFNLHDEQGRVRATLAGQPDGSTRLVIQDVEGNARLRLSVLADGSPGITLADRDGRSRAALGFLPDETTTLVFADRNGQTRAVLGVSADESTMLVFADGIGETRAGLTVTSRGEPSFSLIESEPGGSDNGGPQDAGEASRP